MSTAEKQASERFLRLAHRDIQKSTSLPEFQDATMPGVLERPSLLTMTRLWDAETWVQHRAIGRWWMFLKGWPSSSILRAIRLPLSALTAFAACAIALNQLLVAVGLARLTLPLAPLSLQARLSLGLSLSPSLPLTLVWTLTLTLTALAAGVDRRPAPRLPQQPDARPAQ